MKNIVVIGDVVHDVVVDLVPSERPSVEDAPLYFERSRLTLLGGAANVAKHCARLGAKVYLLHDDGPLSFQGDDRLTTDEQLRIVQKWGNKQNVVKERYYNGKRKVLKVNRINQMRDTGLNPAKALDEILGRFSAQTIIACDNGHDMFSADDASAVVSVCKKHGRELFVDAQLSQRKPNFSAWNGADCIFLNQTEYSAISSVELAAFKSWHIKRGRDGSVFWVDLGTTIPHRGYDVDVVDTLGAGDAYLAAWAVKGDLNIANGWAALSCKQRATQLPELNEMRYLHEDFIGFC